MLDLWRASVLIVDDSEQYARVLTWMLTSELNFKDVAWASSADQGFDMVSKEPHRFSLLFVDYVLPGGPNGCLFLSRLFEAGLMEDRAALLCTAEPQLERLTDAKRWGALGLIIKPFDSKQLRDQLEKAERALRIRSDSF